MLIPAWCRRGRRQVWSRGQFAANVTGATMQSASSGVTTAPASNIDLTAEDTAALRRPREGEARRHVSSKAYGKYFDQLEEFVFSSCEG